MLIVQFDSAEKEKNQFNGDRNHLESLQIKSLALNGWVMHSETKERKWGIEEPKLEKQTSWT